MSSAAWFAKRLGGAQSPSTPTGTTQVPSHQPAANAAPAAPQQAQQPVDPNDVKPGDPGSFSYALKEGKTAGGPATKTKSVGVCPGCGGGHYFVLKNGPSCFDCGYPLIQFGSELGEGSQQ